eukprot:TRINITY_DN4385_c0_g1_i1.p1 TRINITY_DN4385_c0_g1~~TRINITY_DN4385_c0_g1_i1.p1  ORF type:complete len:189 (-),score=40.13 TRINITY_DN4385_c0_g1_i1:108-674(-)
MIEPMDMHSYYARTSNIASQAFSVIMGMAFLCACTSYFLNEPVQVALSNIQPSLRRLPPSRMGVDHVVFEFDLHADFTPLFHWNTRQIFLTIRAEYNTTHTRPKDEFVIWDRIINRKEIADVKHVKMRSEYNLEDPFESMRGKVIDLRIIYEIFPNIGLMTLVDGGHVRLKLPEIYQSPSVGERYRRY